MPRARLRSRQQCNEGVDGSSRQGACETPAHGFSVQNDLLFVARAVGMEPFVKLSRTRVDLWHAKEGVDALDSRVNEAGGDKRVAAPTAPRVLGSLRHPV